VGRLQRRRRRLEAPPAGHRPRRGLDDRRDRGTRRRAPARRDRPGDLEEAYVDLGLQRTCVFAEYGWNKIDSFGSGVGADPEQPGLRFGLSMEF